MHSDRLSVGQIASELARGNQVWTKPCKANEEQALAELALVGVRRGPEAPGRGGEVAQLGEIELAAAREGTLT
jgi:hypothetical protein